MELAHRMRLSIRRRAGHVVLRAELAGLGSASQVSHALKVLQRDGELLRLGAGVYAKTRRDAATGAARPLADFRLLAQEAARKLKLAAHAQTVQDRGPALVLDTGRRRVSRKLALDGRRVVYVNDRTRARSQELPTVGVARFVRELARKHHISYTRTPLDPWAETVTRLAGDEAGHGPVQDLLVALKRAGKLSTDDMAALLVNYLRERKQDVRSV